jgi:hypothetical protein
MIYRRKWLTAALMSLVFMLGSALTLADDAVEEVPLIDGSIWAESTEVEKESYLVGAGNFMTVEYVFQKQMKDPPTDEQSAVPRYWHAIEDVTLNDMIGAIDSWYAENPDKLETPVLVVIWNEYVEKE